MKRQLWKAPRIIRYSASATCPSEFFHESLSIAIVLRCKNDCTWVCAHGNQLIHRTVVRVYPHYILTLSFLSSSCPRHPPRRPFYRSRRSAFTLWAYMLSLSLSLSFMRMYSRYEDISRDWVRRSRASCGSISFYMCVECPATYADTMRR